MKKLTLLSCLLFLAPVILLAQPRVIAESQEIEEPTKGYLKILLLSNGNTAFLHVSEKGTLSIRLYDAAHKEKVVTEIEPSYGNLRGMVNRIFEINGDIVAFATDYEKRQPVLYRIVIDGTTGKLKEDRKIDELDRVSRAMGYAITFGNTPMPRFYINQALNNSSYTIVSTMESAQGLAVTATLFDSSHREVNVVSELFTKERYPYIGVRELTVSKPGTIHILLAGNTSAKKEVDSSFVLLATIATSQKKIAIKRLSFPNATSIVSTLGKYNPVTQKIIYFVRTKEGVGKKYVFSTYLALLNLQTLELEQIISPAISQDMQAKYKAETGNTEDYAGLPQELYIHEDGSFTMIYQEIRIWSGTFSDGSRTYRTYLSNMLITDFSPQATALNAYYIPKSYLIYDMTFGEFYLSKNGGELNFLFRGNQYKEAAYISCQNKRILLANDWKENFERFLQRKKPEYVAASSESDAFCYNLLGDKMVVAPQSVFGLPDDKKEFRFGLFTAGDYDKNKNVYVTYRMIKRKKQETGQLVWLQF